MPDHINIIYLTDDFFSLGGNSLSATQLVANINQEFEVEISLPILFANSRLAELSAVIANLANEKKSSFNKIAKIDFTGKIPLSFRFCSLFSSCIFSRKSSERTDSASSRL